MTDEARPLREIVAHELDESWSTREGADRAIAAVFRRLENYAKTEAEAGNIFSAGVLLATLKAARTAAERKP